MDILKEYPLIDEHGKRYRNSVYIACKDGDSAVLRAFDSLSKVSDYCRGERYEGDRSRPEHIAAMSDKWEHLTAAAIEDF